MVSISVVTVSLNSARQIPRALESVVAQGDSLFEFILVDGKSSDGTVGIVENYRPQLGSRLRILSESDSGLYDAMNKGIALARGDVVGLLNSDDEYLPGALRDVQSTFALEDADVVLADVIAVTENGDFRISSDARDLKKKMTIAHPGCFVRRDLYARIGGFDIRYRIAADYDFLLRCFRFGARFSRLNRVVTRFAGGGASSRSWQLAGEMFTIHSRQISKWHASFYLVIRAGSILGLKLRRSFGVMLLGGDRYHRLARWLRTRRKILF